MSREIRVINKYGEERTIIVDNSDAIKFNHSTLNTTWIGDSGGSKKEVATIVLDGNKTVYLHRFISNLPKGVRINFINGNSLDCRSENLGAKYKEQIKKIEEIIEESGPTLNRLRALENLKEYKRTSRFSNVSYDQSVDKWIVSVCKNGKRIKSIIDTEEEANEEAVYLRVQLEANENPNMDTENEFVEMNLENLYNHFRIYSIEKSRVPDLTLSQYLNNDHSREISAINENSTTWKELIEEYKEVIKSNSITADEFLKNKFIE